MTTKPDKALTSATNAVLLMRSRVSASVVAQAAITAYLSEQDSEYGEFVKMLREEARFEDVAEAVNDAATAIETLVAANRDEAVYAQRLHAMHKTQSERAETAEAEVSRLKERVDKWRVDASTLLAQIDWLCEATGEGMERDDAAVVHGIRLALMESKP